VTREELLENPDAFIQKHRGIVDANALLTAKSELLEEQIRDLTKELRQLKAMIAQSLYGRRSERDLEGQLGLPFSAELEGAMAMLVGGSEKEAPSAANEAANAPVKKKRKRGRTVIPEHVRRERQVHEKSAKELDALFGVGKWREIGEEIREELDYRPSSIFVTEHVTKKYASIDRSLPPVRAESPKAIIPKGRPGAGLLAHLIVSKFGDHLPIYRLNKIFKRERIDIPRTTMCRWLQESSLLLRGIVAELRKTILAGDIIRTDATPVTMLDPNSRNGSRKVCMWPYMSHDHLVVFDFTVGGSRDGPRAFLGDFKGYMQADAHSVYDAFYGEDIIEVGCMAHARRKIYKSRDNFPEDANHGLALIKGLYQIEEKAKESGLGYEEVYVLRQEMAKPQLETLKEWAERTQEKVLPSSGLGNAVSYMLNHFAALQRYIDDGRLSIDNNDVEREIRQVGLGRKNFLFFGGERGGEVAAVFYTLIANCALEKINPFEYLRDVLQKASALKADEVGALTPRNWKAAKEAAAADNATASTN
jgi:transposase